ncbi:MAG: sulfite exporter TauE/SafE family protein [Acidobacteria bacterium]|nr:sulfite exporter TauE/SafE family protein [Acidobacteriota bacterium]MCG3195064.1 hypothetical protein [Thermoanaerobaculia bacterium]MCK6682009.1 sulfite exporter TauE/SafE family protein [Thermoanaerobaculia bacterium]
MTLLAFPAGILIAAVAIFTGIGGGILWMPFLIAFFKLPPAEAVSCSLVIQVFGQVSATTVHLRSGRVETGLVIRLLPFVLVSTAAGTLAGPLIPPRLLQVGVGVLTFLVVYVFLRGDEFQGEAGGDTADPAGLPAVRRVTVVGSFLSALVSAGLADWLIPALHHRCRLTIARSVATGVAVMCAVSISAAAFHLAGGRAVNFAIVIPAAAGVVIGAQIGARLHHRVPGELFKEIFVLILVLFAAHVTFEAF